MNRKSVTHARFFLRQSFAGALTCLLLLCSASDTRAAVFALLENNASLFNVDLNATGTIGANQTGQEKNTFFIGNYTETVDKFELDVRSAGTFDFNKDGKQGYDLKFGPRWDVQVSFSFEDKGGSFGDNPDTIQANAVRGKHIIPHEEESEGQGPTYFRVGEIIDASLQTDSLKHFALDSLCDSHAQHTDCYFGLDLIVTFDTEANSVSNFVFLMKGEHLRRANVVAAPDILSLIALALSLLFAEVAYKRVGLSPITR
jgi:hypothetical protein